MKDKAMGMEPGFSDNQDDWQKVRDGIPFSTVANVIYGMSLER